MTKTFAERCQLAQQSLPDAQYRAMLTKLHDEMLEALAEQPAQQEPYGWHTEDHLTDRSATTYSKDVADRWKSKGWPVTPFYTTPQPPAQQKPVAWMSDRAVGFKRSEFGATPTVPLYTTPQPPAQPLTDAQIFDLAEPFGAFEYGDAQGHKRLAFARAIEAAHGITKGNT